MNEYGYGRYRENDSRIFDSKGAMSLRAYNVTIGLILMWGFVINVLMCKFCTELFLSWDYTVVVIGYFVVALIGIFMNVASDNPLVSFIGYNLIVLPVGVVLSIGLSEYDQISIMNALITTTVVTVVMIVLATVVPNVFLSMGKVLFACLTAVVICEIVLLLIGVSTPSIWDFCVALIFCGYIGYDWAKAQKKHRTLDNAIDSVAELYLDIINLFLRILSSSSKSSKKSHR